MWVYVRSGNVGNPLNSSGVTPSVQASVVPPPDGVVEFVLRKQEESQVGKTEFFSNLHDYDSCSCAYYSCHETARIN